VSPSSSPLFSLSAAVLCSELIGLDPKEEPSSRRQ
jgi:hypothetical protein